MNETMSGLTAKQAKQARARRLSAATLSSFFALVTLAACDKTAVPATVDPAPVATRAEMPGIPASGADTSVPSASQALTNGPPIGGAATADGNGPNQRSAVSNTQEQQSMPLPGQANDHSNTVAEDKKPASAPR